MNILTRTIGIAVAAVSLVGCAPYQHQYKSAYMQGCMDVICTGPPLECVEFFRARRHWPRDLAELMTHADGRLRTYSDLQMCRSGRRIVMWYTVNLGEGAVFEHWTLIHNPESINEIVAERRIARIDGFTMSKDVIRIDSLKNNE